MSKPTPGPWGLCFHLQSEEKDKSCQCGHKGDIWGGDGKAVVCSIGVPHIDESSEMVPRYDRATDLANARLIVAAPELLEALKAARADIPAMYQSAYGRSWPTNAVLKRQMDEAIAKAEGK